MVLAHTPIPRRFYYHYSPMKKEHINEIKGIIILALGLILLASLVSYVPEDLSWFTSQPNIPAKNLIRIVGAYMAAVLFFIFGTSTYFLVVALFFWSWNKFRSRDIHFTWAKFFSSLILISVISSLLGMLGPQGEVLRFQKAGMVGFLTGDFLIRYLGRTGAYIILFTLGVLTLVLAGEFLVSPLLFRMMSFFQSRLLALKAGALGADGKPSARIRKPAAQPRFKIDRTKESVAQSPQGLNLLKRLKAQEEKAEKDEKESIIANLIGKKEKETKPNIHITQKQQEEPKIEEKIEPKIVGEYHIPSMDLLADPPQISTSRLQQGLEQGAKTLEETLANFNVDARVADVEHGPVITRFELEPGPGVKVQKITTLADDIALAMRAAAVRIVAPIPGKNRVGIEVPNSSTAAVYLKEVLSRHEYQNAKSKLMLGIGKDISGKPLIADLGDMPHLLIAGTTGSGKTVCVNTLIMSLLYNATPQELKFLMVDPKMVELSIYNDIPHMLCPAVTDPKKVSAALNWVVGEMESRYQILLKAGVKHINSYHAQGNNMPFIVVVIDELADLMQVAAKTIESAITRLAQLSRAVGIHLVLATQRPSVDVITGVIKANFPARISFKVASKIDSRTVLDANGAETLLGKGDLLFIQPGQAKPSRGQCSFVSDDEVRRVIDFIKNQQQPVYDDTILTKQPGSGPGGSEQKDELYDEAVRLVIETNQASVSILQRRMRLGYTRAARLIDMMEQNGVVGPYCGSKPRDLLVNREEWLMEHMSNDAESQAS